MQQNNWSTIQQLLQVTATASKAVAEANAAAARVTAAVDDLKAAQDTPHRDIKNTRQTHTPTRKRRKSSRRTPVYDESNSESPTPTPPKGKSRRRHYHHPVPYNNVPIPPHSSMYQYNNPTMMIAGPRAFQINPNPSPFVGSPMMGMGMIPNMHMQFQQATKLVILI